MFGKVYACFLWIPIELHRVPPPLNCRNHHSFDRESSGTALAAIEMI
jgi:hypothetical protein